MVQSFKFAIIRLAPEGVRDERINVGLIVFRNDNADVRLPARLDKVRVLSAALDKATMQDLAATIHGRDLQTLAAGIGEPHGRAQSIGRVGPLILSELGVLVANNDREYETRISAILQSIVEPEPSAPIFRSKHSRVAIQLRRAFSEQRILARKSEDLSSHRVIQNLPLAEGLVADFALKNGAMHIFETVDAATENVTLKKTVTDIAVSALILEQARINFGKTATRSRLIYQASANVEGAAQSSLDAAAHQGAELYNWASQSDRIKLISSIASLAVPIERKGDKARFISDNNFKLKYG